MAETSFISKQAPQSDDLDFDSLREAGIERVQALCGDLWTDYNVHDPGVTILEVLCYGLSDLAYRTSFDIAEFLSDTDGNLDFDGLALYRPDQILGCDPVTIGDLRKVILDELPYLRNVWIERDASDRLAPALFSLFAELIDASDLAQVETELRELIGRYRMLGEDVDRIEFISSERFGLRGEIEIGDDSDPLSVLAEVHWQAQHYLNPRPAWQRYQEVFAQKKDLEQLFRGPPTRTGWMADDDLAPWRERWFVSELISLIAGIKGVERVNTLTFVDASGEEFDYIDMTGHPDGRRVASLDTGFAGEAGFSVLRTGQRLSFDGNEIERELSRLTLQRGDFAHRAQRFDWIDSLLPKGTPKTTAEYHSIQHHFPDIYGLNAFGVPDSASPERHAQATQLKGYLLLFDQVLANFLAQIDEIPELFSSTAEPGRTYAFTPLDSDTVPRCEELYPLGFTDQRERLEASRYSIDNWCERRHRVLNRLLAMHGHEETRRLVEAIAQARNHSTRNALKAKQTLIKNIREFGASRMRGGSGSADALPPGLERNLSLLFADPALAHADDEVGTLRSYPAPLSVIDHILLRNGQPGEDAKYDVEADKNFCLFRVSVVVSATLMSSLGSEGQLLIDRAIALCCPAHIAATVIYLEKSRYDAFAACVTKWRASAPGADRIRAGIALKAYLVKPVR